MKVILLLALLFQAVVAQSPTATAITTAIKGLYNGNTLLDATKFNSANSYQSRALSDAVRVLAGTGAGTLKITEYYALVCLYYSSNAVANPRTNSIIPGQKLPNWARTTNWINAANYCTWFGIKCKNAGSLVTDVILYNNTLTGELPNEISLLGSSLDYLDLGLNFYHWKGTFDWMTRMTVLQYLAVGTTSFDSDGIPTQIASMKKLSKFHKLLLSCYTCPPGLARLVCIHGYTTLCTCPRPTSPFLPTWTNTNSSFHHSHHFLPQSNSTSPTHSFEVKSHQLPLVASTA